MFTGLIEEIGTITGLKKQNNSLYLTISANKIVRGINIGDSVAINGACQTVTAFDDTQFEVFASPETLSVTTFENFKIGTKVNLERTLRLNDRLDGHIVSGHVDTTAQISDIKQNGEAKDFIFKIPQKYTKQIVNKGSITIDGISLTVSDVSYDKFRVTVIPITYQSTNLNTLKIGDYVNIETDILAKYVEKYLSSNHNNSNIDMNMLERNGFL